LNYNWQVTASTLNSATTACKYDNVGDVLEMCMANGGIVKYSCDQVNRLTKCTDILGQSKTNSYDSHSDITSEKFRTFATQKQSYGLSDTFSNSKMVTKQKLKNIPKTMMVYLS
jgi:YD repeat-containing protein